MRIFKTKWFARFARKEGIDDNKLLNAIELDAYKRLAQVFLGFSDKDIAKAMKAGELMEVDTHDQEV